MGSITKFALLIRTMLFQKVIVFVFLGYLSATVKVYSAQMICLGPFVDLRIHLSFVLGNFHASLANIDCMVEI